MANIFYTNVFRTQENVNKDNMNYTVVDKDQKLSAYFPMPSANANGIFPGVICNGIGSIYNQFGFNSTTNQFLLTAGVIRFPDAISNNTPYNVTNQTASISQFLSEDSATVTLPIADGTFYLVATLQVTGSGSSYQYTNTSPPIPYTVIAKSTFTPTASLTQVALCLITIVGTYVTISTDVNCAINYGTTVPTKQILIFTDRNTFTPQPYPTLNAPVGAIGVFITATSFGGNGGAGGSSDDNSVGGGGGGAGAGVNNLYFPLSTTERQFSVAYNPASNGNLILFGPGQTLNLNNGFNGASGASGGTGGKNGQGSSLTIFIPYQTLGTGQNGGANGGYGGVSSLSAGQEVRAVGAFMGQTPPLPASNGTGYGAGGGGGGGIGTATTGGIGGNAIVIAEWVF